jgi:hypothetical protein
MLPRREISRSLVLKGSHYWLYFNQSGDMALDAASRVLHRWGILAQFRRLGREK